MDAGDERDRPEGGEQTGMTEGFTIAELVERTDVPRATIHHYVAKGVLPPARKVASNRFLYGEEHVTALQLVKRLRDQRGLPLDVIASVLPDLIALGPVEALRAERWDEHLGSTDGGPNAPPDKRLLDAATTAFSRHGYGAVNIDEVCAAAGVAKGSLYRHFPSKEELFFAAAANAAVQVGKDFDALKSSRGVQETDELAEILAEALEPRLPLLLELWSRALQHHPGHAAVAGFVFKTLRREVGRHLDRSDARQLSEVVVPHAVLKVWNRMLASAEPSAVLDITIA
jgi:AcrR family transcriptional regulator